MVALSQPERTVTPVRGTLQQRTPGSWRLRVEAPADPTTGRRRYVTKTVRGTKRVAENELAQLVAHVTGGHVSAERRTFADLVDAWLEHAGPGMSPLTVATYRSVLNVHVLPALGAKTLRDVNTEALDALYRTMRSKNLSVGYIRKAHTICSAALTQAVRWRWIAKNPASDATPGTTPRPLNRAPKSDVVQRCLTYVAEHDPEFYAFVHLEVMTGARRGEICALRWEDLDLDRRRCRFWRAVISIPGAGPIVKATKTEDERTVTLSPSTITALREHRRRQRERLMACGAHMEDDDFVFPSRLDGRRPMRPDSVSHRWLRHRRHVPGAAGIRFHDLRHHAATQLISEGVDHRTVMGRMGWSSLRTVDRYAAFVEAKDRAAADILERVMGGLN